MENRTRKVSKAVAVAILAVLAITGWATAKSSDETKPTVASVGWDSGVRDGDLVFRRGRDMMSNLVLAGSGGGQFSHVGIAVWRDGRLNIIHAMPDENGITNGVIEEIAEIFAGADVAVAVKAVRLPLNEAQRQQVATVARSMLGRGFDDAFSMKSDDQVYCTELAVKALWEVWPKFQVAAVSLPTLGEPVMMPDALYLAATAERSAAINW